MPYSVGVKSEGRQGNWVVAFKKDGSDYLRTWLLTFGIFNSEDEALTRVEWAFRFGVGKLSREEFLRQTQGGAFYAVPVSKYFRTDGKRSALDGVLA